MPTLTKSVNVHLQQRDPASLLNALEKMIRVRKAHHEFGWGEWRVVDATEPGVFALRSEHAGSCVVAVHNLSGAELITRLDLPDSDREGLVEILGDRAYEARKGEEFELDGYGYRWFRRGVLGP